LHSFFNLNRLFHKYSKSRALHISSAELLKLLHDELTPASIVNSIDNSISKISEAEYHKAILILQLKSHQESDFFFSFKQNELHPHKSLITSDLPPIPRLHIPNTQIENNPNSRNLFFKVMCEIDHDYWNKETFYRAFQLANLFTYLINDSRFLVSAHTLIEVLPKYYDLVNPVISNIQRKNFMFYKELHKDIYIDLIEFLIVENHTNKLRLVKASNTNTITESQLKTIMRDYGMEGIKDNTLHLQKKRI